MRVAIAQINPVLGDLGTNLLKHIEMIEAAKSEGVDFLLFPELSLTGYALRDKTLDQAVKKDDPRILELSELGGDMTIVVGLVEETVAAQLYNSALVLKNGEPIFVHRKLNLPTYGALEESKYFSTGRYVETFNLNKDWRVATLICADVWNPALVHLAALHGATLLAIPKNSADGTVGAEFSNPEVWTKLIEVYAMVYGMPVLAANRCGTENDFIFWGHSQIIGPDGKALATASEAEELIVADIAFNDVRKSRFQLPTVRDSNFALIYREMQRLDSIMGVPDIVRENR